jgi:hypothetical protein
MEDSPGPDPERAEIVKVVAAGLGGDLRHAQITAPVFLHSLPEPAGGLVVGFDCLGAVVALGRRVPAAGG